MNDPFEKRVRAAAVAGWWTLLVAVSFLTLQWFAYLAVMSARPAWLVTLWGRVWIGPSSRTSGSGP